MGNVFKTAGIAERCLGQCCPLQQVYFDVDSIENDGGFKAVKSGLSVAVFVKPAAASAGLSNLVNPGAAGTAGWPVDVRCGPEEREIRIDVPQGASNVNRAASAFQRRGFIGFESPAELPQASQKT